MSSRRWKMSLTPKSRWTRIKVLLQRRSWNRSCLTGIKITIWRSNKSRVMVTPKLKSAKILIRQIQESEELKSFSTRDFQMLLKNLRAVNWILLWRWKVTKNKSYSLNFQSWINKSWCFRKWWRRRLRHSSKRSNNSLSKALKKGSRDHREVLLLGDSKVVTHQQKLWPHMTTIYSATTPWRISNFRLPSTDTTISLISSTKTAPKAMKTCAISSCPSSSLILTPLIIRKSIKCSNL